MTLRSKICQSCQSEKDVLFRARIEKQSAWLFYCEPCLLELKKASKFYQYGGTWKKNKKRK
ncbi:MAG: hypothetical protein HRT44_13480 [Bdellovibrionales bacterium]|nr:hypothetical protein [Bdellovibrionales bacterium]NQZ20250.1 hypothetical protein [Bdellovibrionales bacterium]